MDHRLNRRTLLAAGLTQLMPAVGWAAPARKTLALELVSRDLSLRPGQPPTLAWRFANDAAPRFAQGDVVQVTIANRLPVGVFISWRGLGGSPELEPLLARGPIATGTSETFVLTLRHAGTLICDARLTRENASQPLPLLPIVVAEAAEPAVDRDEVILIEDWRFKPNGSAFPPGVDNNGVEPIYTVNCESTFGLKATLGERLRLRFINGTQRSVIAVQLSGIDVRVVAIDSQPSEPFLARDGRIVMAPGTRIDAIVDVTGPGDIMLNDGTRIVKIGEVVAGQALPRTAPLPPPASLPSNGLPEKLAFQSALRVDLSLDSPEWTTPSEMSAATSAAFRVKRGRTVVLAVTNPTDAAAVLQLHGHHMRLLDRLDDGWKPFWLDTVAVPAKQTVRLAFAATNPGAYLTETFGTGWTSPRKLRSYVVEA